VDEYTSDFEDSVAEALIAVNNLSRQENEAIFVIESKNNFRHVPFRPGAVATRTSPT
jgi:hypothetical protein